MKQKLLLITLALALATAGQAASADTGTPFPPDLKPAPQEARAAYVASEILTRHHYNAMPIDAALSARIFDQYLKSLDAERLLFARSDIDRLTAYRASLGEAILKENLEVPFAMFNLYQRRAAERFAYARTLLQAGFDFRKDETYQFARGKEPWPATEAEMRELWRKRVKNDWLRLRLAGKDDKSIVAVLDKRYDNVLKRMARVRGADAFQTFMNAYTMSIEPHTNYLGPRAAQEFDISMRLSLVGIGASLAELDDYITIRELIPGGPALLSGQLKPGDRIVGVAQGEQGAMTEVLGWRVEDAVTLIRGAPDSVVRLDILPSEAGPDARHRLVSLVRKTISLDAQAAKANIYTVTAGAAARRIGVISLPTFYEDFAGRKKGLKDFRSATRDVARLLEGLRQAKVDSVLVDLRNNGGGSLTEAIELSGLFIDQGPVVQQRSANGAIAVGADTRAGVAWDGPLGVMINRRSASASEIFAAAMQDYGRGLIIGEPSFGKGTVQSLVDLDQIARNPKPQFGQLKMTIAQFFRINGGTTQLRGVTPDILLPEVSDADAIGESSFDNALPWVQIRPAQYAPVADLKGVFPILQAMHETRVKSDKDFLYLQEDLAEARLERKKNVVSLNEAARRAELAARDARLAAREPHKEAGKDKAPANAAMLNDDGLQPDERRLASALEAETALKNAKDVLLNEAVRILSDEVGVLRGKAGLAASTRPN